MTISSSERQDLTPKRGLIDLRWNPIFSPNQVKELGVLFLNCPMFVEDLDKIHTAYCLAADKVPNTWPSEVITRYNHSNPMRVSINGFPSRVYFTVSCLVRWTSYLDLLLLLAYCFPSGWNMMLSVLDQYYFSPLEQVWGKRRSRSSLRFMPSLVMQMQLRVNTDRLRLFPKQSLLFIIDLSYLCHLTWHPNSFLS